MVDPLVSIVAVTGGGAIGATARYGVGVVTESYWTILIVNVLGSFLLGIVLAVPLSESAALTFGVGFCGAFTTFSSFALETVTHAEDTSIGAAWYGLGTLTLALVALGAGHALGAVAIG